MLEFINLDFVSNLYLIPSLVMQGEIWRLITFIFIPPSASMIFILFVLYFYYLIGSQLEVEWGPFRFNLYYFLGMIGTILSSFITWSPVSAVYLNLTLFLAFARLNPNYQIYIFFIIPVKVKFLAWLYWIIIIYTLLFASMPNKLAAIISLLNYYAFFGRDMVDQTRLNRQVAKNRKRFRSSLPKKMIMHKCTICGITEVDDPDMEFRYCSKCDEELEYCMNHLHEHEHVIQRSDNGGQKTE